MIARIWHGWTPPNADAYERLLKTEIFPSIAARGIAGYRGIELLRRPRGAEVEFVTIMWFESLDAVRAFAGDDYERAYVPEAARRVLARWDQRSQHYTVAALMLRQAQHEGLILSLSRGLPRADARTDEARLPELARSVSDGPGSRSRFR